MEPTEAPAGRSFVKMQKCRIVKQNRRSCVISELSARGQLAETTLLHIFAGSTDLIISPSATSKKAAPSSDMRKIHQSAVQGKDVTY